LISPFWDPEIIIRVYISGKSALLRLLNGPVSIFLRKWRQHTAVILLECFGMTISYCPSLSRIGICVNRFKSMISMVPSMKPTQVRGLNVSSTVFDFYVVIDEIVCMKLSSLGSYLSASIMLTWVSLSSSLSGITYIGYSIIEFDILLSCLLLCLLILESLIFNDSSYIYCYWRLMMLTISRMLFFLPPRPLNVWD